MAGFSRAFGAAMLQPVEELSDDDTATPTPMKKPAGLPVGKNRKNTDESVEPGTADSSSAPKKKPMKRPAAQTTPGGSGASPMKKPAAAAKPFSVCKYFYKKDNTWGFKIHQKQVMLVPWLQIKQFNDSCKWLAKRISDLLGNPVQIKPMVR